MPFENYEIIEPYNLYGLVQKIDSRFNQLQYKATKDYLESDEHREGIQTKAKNHMTQAIEMKKGINNLDEPTQQKNNLYTNSIVSNNKQPMGSGKFPVKGFKKNGGLLFPMKKKCGGSAIPKFAYD